MRMQMETRVLPEPCADFFQSGHRRFVPLGISRLNPPDLRRQVAGDRSAETLHDGPKYSLGAGYCGPISCPMQGVEIDGSEFSVESVPIWKTSGRTFCRYPLAPRTCWLRTGSD